LCAGGGVKRVALRQQSGIAPKSVKTETNRPFHRLSTSAAHASFTVALFVIGMRAGRYEWVSRIASNG
jgi:hypothetical protein